MPIVAWIAGKLGISSLKFGLYLALGLAIVTAVALAWSHYTGLIKSVVTLTANNAKMDSAISQQKQTIEAAEGAIQEWKGNQLQYQMNIAEAARVANEARSEVKRLNDVLSKHNLTELSKAKPALIEHRLNDGTRDAARMLRCASSGNRDKDCPGQD